MLRIERISQKSIERQAIEDNQDDIIGHLAEIDSHLAGQLLRCKHDRLHRNAGTYPYRCRSIACWACRRSIVSRWQVALCHWLSSASSSLAIFQIDGVEAIPKLSRSLRNSRDRAARDDVRWARVAFGGIAKNANEIDILIKHDGLVRQEVQQRFPAAIVVTAPSCVEQRQAFDFTTEEIVALGTKRRASQPLRIIVPAQLAAELGHDDAPMPIVF